MSVLAEPLFNWLPFVGTGSLALAWAVAFVTQRPRPEMVMGRAMNASVLAFVIAALTLWRAVQFGPWQVELGTLLWLPLTLQFDMLSAGMLTLVSLIGAICIRFSISYLDGDIRQSDFVARMLLTLITVSVLVTSGSLLMLWLSWVSLSLSLGGLLVFYADRVRAVAAARKRFWLARIGDLALALAFLAILDAAGTSNISAIAELAASGQLLASSTLALGMVLLAIAALLKSAQFPSHSWLTEVMETPTPVSALLHAGIVNAGGFLVLRFADVLLLVPDAMLLLAIIGGVSALMGSLVMLFQTSIKVSLAWSTVAQMGFMMLQIGLGAFAAAAIHIVAHSFYKAHAFLSSGSVIDTARLLTLAGRAPLAQPVSRALMLTVVALLYIIIVNTVSGAPLSAAALMGLVATIGLAQFVFDEIGTKASPQLVARLLLAAATGAGVYLGLHSAANSALQGVLPQTADVGQHGWLILAFGVALLLLALFRGWIVHPDHRDAFAALKVHLSNGLYLSVLTDRLVGRYRVSERRWPMVVPAENKRVAGE